MPFFMVTFFNWLENASWATHIRQSMWLYPALEIAHIVGIVMLVGAAFVFDLRLLGFSNTLSITGLSRHVLPWSRRGLILIVPSGILLFMTNATALGVNPTFWLKMMLLGIAALNVLIFHRVVYKHGTALADQHNPPFAAKVSALVSIVAWIAIIACGRLLAY
ncbi:DUF6644 family protein [Parapedobacter sp. DT-150]|uniref:DUF6644 family protein n=1 Tax=Parapedobacter sp. DT-150 TaxID=3396162 RepID=UPI003F1BA2D4